MARSRLELQAELEELLGTRNVYHNPPSNLTMQYPCIRYSLDDIRITRANNAIYKSMKRYQLVYITQTADDPMEDALLELPYVRFARKYTESNLHHTVFDLYF